MTNIAISLTVVLVVLFAGSQAKVFNKCSLAREMFRLGVPKSELPDWVCLAFHESRYDTRAINPINTDHSKDWGIFQINDRYWCKPNDGRRSSNMCTIECTDLLSDNINQSVRCARKIQQTQGFRAWVAWNENCQRNKPSVNECF